MLLLLLGGCLLLAPPPEAVERWLDRGRADQVAAGGDSACAVFRSGGLFCTDERLSPPGLDFTMVDADGGWCGLTDDDEIECFGGFPDPPSGDFYRIALGRDVGCAVADDRSREVECWGEDPARADAPYLEGIVAIAVGDSAACAVESDAHIRCWGAEGSKVVDDQRDLVDFTAIALAGEAACGIDEDAEIECWGEDGINHLLASPRGKFESITGGQDHFCALDEDGEVACWGGNAVGQATPEAGPFEQIDAGRGSTCGVREDGTVVCWGGAAGATFATDP